MNAYEKNGHRFVLRNGMYACERCGVATGNADVLKPCGKAAEPPPPDESTPGKVVALFDALRGAKRK